METFGFPCIGLCSVDELVGRFREFQLVDLRRDKKTAYEKVYYVRKFLVQFGRDAHTVTVDDIRAYLKDLDSVGPATYKNILGALKVFFRDFLGMPYVVQSFRFPRQPFRPRRIFSKEDLQRFYIALRSPKERALFLLYATTGLRRNEILRLTEENIDLAVRLVTPKSHTGDTKNSWLSFYNEETDKVLREYLAVKTHSVSKRIFPMARNEERRLWKTAKEKTGLDITPQRLREWFCNQMALLGVSDRYIDAFCGRTPKTILARHYTDFSPDTLKAIYDKAGLKVLS